MAEKSREDSLRNEHSSASLAAPIKEESMKKRIRRAKLREADEDARMRESSGKKPYVVQVKATGLIDSACIGHLRWQERVRNLTPRMLDMSIITYDDQSEDSKCKLWEALRTKFEFIENELTDELSDKMIKVSLRKHRERTKRIHRGKVKASGKYTNKEWAALRKYWNSPSTKQQSEKMAETRKRVAYNPRVGRHGYARKAAQMVSVIYVIKL